MKSVPLERVAALFPMACFSHQKKSLMYSPGAWSGAVVNFSLNDTPNLGPKCSVYGGSSPGSSLASLGVEPLLHELGQG